LGKTVDWENAFSTQDKPPHMEVILTLMDGGKQILALLPLHPLALAQITLPFPVIAMYRVIALALTIIPQFTETGSRVT